MTLPLILALLVQCPDGSPAPCRGLRSSAPSPMSVAVLDFTSLSRDTADAFLGEGLAEELTSRLGQVGRLMVASRTTVRRLQGAASMPVPQIGRSLNVAHIVTGSVRRSGQRLRVTVELLRAASGAQLWTRQFDRSDTDLLTIQEEIATEVAGAVAGRLLPAERSTLVARPTTSLQAYEAFLRGRVLYHRGWALERGYQVIRLFERAVELDPAFADAWALLSRAHARLHQIGVDRTPERAALARAAAERAVELAPSSPLGLTSMGYYHYWIGRDYDAALRLFSAALASQPNDIDVHNAIAYVTRRQGRWDLSQESRTHAMRIDPANGLLAVNRADSWTMLRRFTEARADLQRALPLVSDSLYAYFSMLELALASGEAPDAQAVEYLRGRGRELPQLLMVGTSVLRAIPGLHGVLDSVAPPASPDARLAFLTVLADLRLLRGMPDARAVLDSARALGEVLVRRSPEDDAFHAQLALTYARLGRCAEALRGAERAATLLPPSRDAYVGPDRLMVQAQVAAICGERDRSVALIEELLRMPSFLTPPILRMDPIWTPLRGHGGFERLVNGN